MQNSEGFPQQLPDGIGAPSGPGIVEQVRGQLLRFLQDLRGDFPEGPPLHFNAKSLCQGAEALPGLLPEG